MQKMNRRNFCGTSLLALPLANVLVGETRAGDLPVETDPVMDALAEEFAETTMDGARAGFGAAHFHRYAGQVRIFNACMEERGTNRRINRKLGEDDYYLFDPEKMVSITRDYWQRHGIILNEGDLVELSALDLHSYKSVKKSLKKQGGVQQFHERIAELFERKAEEHASGDLKSGLTLRNGFLKFPGFKAQKNRVRFKNTDYEELSDFVDPGLLAGMDVDCLCKAMTVEGAVLSVMCVTVCQPCCVPAAMMVAFVTLMESFDYCDASQC